METNIILTKKRPWCQLWIWPFSHCFTFLHFFTTRTLDLRLWFCLCIVYIWIEEIGLQVLLVLWQCYFDKLILFGSFLWLCKVFNCQDFFFFSPSFQSDNFWRSEIALGPRFSTRCPKKVPDQLLVWRTRDLWRF